MSHEQLPLFYIAENGDVSDEGVPEFHWVNGVLYLCHQDDHYCPERMAES